MGTLKIGLGTDHIKAGRLKKACAEISRCLDALNSSVKNKATVRDWKPIKVPARSNPGSDPQIEDTGKKCEPFPYDPPAGGGGDSEKQISFGEAIDVLAHNLNMCNAFIQSLEDDLVIYLEE